MRNQIDARPISTHTHAQKTQKKKKHIHWNDPGFVWSSAARHSSSQSDNTAQPANEMNCKNMQLCINKVRYICIALPETRPSNVYTQIV